MGCNLAPSNEDNYLALAVCILTDLGPDEAFARVVPRTYTEYLQQKQRETLEMIRLKNKGLTYNQIGERFEMKGNAVCKRIKRYQEGRARIEQSG